MSKNDPNTEIFKVFSVFGQTKCHSLVCPKEAVAQLYFKYIFQEIQNVGSFYQIWRN